MRHVDAFPRHPRSRSVIAMALSDREVAACEVIAAALRDVEAHRRPDVVQAAIGLLRGHAVPHLVRREDTTAPIGPPIRRR